MNTETVIINDIENHEAQADFKRAGAVIKQGGLVAFPTETVYGLGGDALNPEASGKIYAAKGRPSDNPLIVHIAELDDLYRIVTEVKEEAVKLAEAFWPGPLTMIFPKADIVPLATTGGLETVAVRMPSNKIALEFIKASGGYIAAPSANLSGRPSPTSARHVADDLSGRIEMIIDGGPCTIGLESTIVDLTGDAPMILRPGYVSQKMLEDVVGEVAIDPAITGPVDENVHPKAPGMKYRHYAPKGLLTIVSGDSKAVTEYIKAHIEENHSKGKRVGVIAAQESLKEYVKADFCGNAGCINDEVEISSGLYGLLRECDERAIDVIYSEEFDTPQLGMAIMNRLMKAAGHTVVNV